MTFFFQLKAIIATGLLSIIGLWSYAHNGAIAHAYPMEPISVDANLSDWPEHFKEYPISFYQYGFKPESSDDIRGYFKIGYNQELQEVYIGVEMIDDSYIRNEENPEYWAHDMQVLYIDPQHKTGGTGVLALEVNEYFRKIVDQSMNWDPFVLNASWDMVTVKAKRYENNTIYEWKIKLDGFIKEGRTLGFDYVVFDKDSPNENTNTVGWGKDEGVKHECSKCLGDVLLVPDNARFSNIEGRVKPMNDSIFPQSVRFLYEKEPANFVSMAVDSNGYYSSKIFPGKYKLTIPPGLLEVDEKIYRMGIGDTVSVSALPDQTSIVTKALQPSTLPRPDLIPEKGLLHNFDKESQEELDQIIENYRKYYGIPGVSLALIRDGKLHYHNTYGYRNNFTKDLVDSTTLFEAASITKPVFAYTVLRLAERGIIDLDKPLAEYLPFEDLEEYPEYKKMTGRHVLIHKTGLPNWGREMQAEPGEKFGYSGEGFEYLKRVLVEITGKESDQLVKEELIELQHIGHMKFRDDGELSEVVATGHIDESPTVRNLPKEPGMAWSMHTEAIEFSKFALTLLERKGLKEATFQEMMAFQSEYPEDWKADKNYKEGMGLGISLRQTDFGKVFGHGGNNGDFKCMFEVYEDLKMGYIIFTNSNTGDSLADDMAQILIEGKRVIKEAESTGGN